MNLRLTSILKLGLIPVLGTVALAASSGLTHAQTPPPSQQPIAPAIAGGGQGAQAQIWTDQSYYYVGQPIEYCVAVPFPGQVRIYDHLPNGQTHLINNFYEWNNYECFWGTVTPPTGHESLEVVFTSGGFYQSAFTSFYTFY